MPAAAPTSPSTASPRAPMRIAWFRPTEPRSDDPLDATGRLISGLRSRHAIEIVDEKRAFDFAWRHARQPFDLCVYELDNTPAHRYVASYLLHYPGLTLVAALTGHEPRAARVSRLTIASLAAAADLLRAEAPDAEVRCLGWWGTGTGAGEPGTGIRGPGSGIRGPGSGIGDPRPLLLGAIDDGQAASRIAVIERACARAREAGARVELRVSGDARDVLAESDVMLALRWPMSAAALAAAFAAFASRRPAIVFECLETADWPALDPQSWLARGPLATAPPICVSLDPRDEEHSLAIALVRLAGDAALRRELGDAAEAWWTRHGLAEPLDRFEAALEDARARVPPPGAAAGAGVDDGTGLARRILADLGVTTDLFPSDTPARS